MYNNEIFEGKTLSDVFQDIYKNTDSKRSQIATFITKLVPLIRTPEDAVMVGPLIKEFMDVGVKNDEHIVRLAQIAQRIESVSSKAVSGGDTLTEQEKLEILKNLGNDVKSVLEESLSLKEDLDNLKTSI